MPWCHNAMGCILVTPPKRNTSWNFKEDQLVLCSETTPPALQKHEWTIQLCGSISINHFPLKKPSRNCHFANGAVGVNLDNLGYVKSIEIPYIYGEIYAEIYAKSKPQKLCFHRIKNGRKICPRCSLRYHVPGQDRARSGSWSWSELVSRWMKHVQTNPIYPLVY